MIGASNKFTDLKEAIISVDGSEITTGVLECHIWQDISTPSWSCTIAISDTSNMISSIPMKQGSKITIMLQSDTVKSLATTVRYEFVLYSITGRDIQKSKHQAYVIHGITESYIKNQGVRIQKSFNGTSSSIVQQVVSELGGSVQTSGSSENLSLIVPNMTPFAAANWLAKFAVYQNSADFFFFMSKLNGPEYMFKSFEDMYSSSSGITLKQGLASMRDGGSNLVESDAFNMLHYQIEHYDAISNLGAGYYANETVMFDWRKQKWYTKKFKFGDDNGQDKSMSAVSGVFNSIKEKSFQSYIAVNDKIYDGDHANKRSVVEKYSCSRRSSVMKMEQDRIFIQVAGQAKYGEMLLGKTVEVNLQSHEDVSGENLDKYYSGKYLVVAIEHLVAGKEYYVNLELVKKRLKVGM
jgi:hypothetical protein